MPVTFATRFDKPKNAVIAVMSQMSSSSKPCACSASKSPSFDAVRLVADLHREVEHRALARRDVGLAVVDRDLIGHQRFLLVDAQQRAVCNHAVQALVGRTGCGHDHLAVALGQAALFLQHQRVVIREERAPFSGAPRERQKHVRHEAGFFLHLEHLGADVVGQVFQLGGGVAGHGAVLFLSHRLGAH